MSVAPFKMKATLDTRFVTKIFITFNPTSLQENTFENIMTKKEIAHNEKLLIMSNISFCHNVF